MSGSCSTPCPQSVDAVEARARLAVQQEGLVAALVAGGDVPDGFDAVRVAAAARALRRKRAGEVARAWPMVAAAYGSGWTATFASWAADCPPRGSWLDGYDFALAHRGQL